MKSENLHIKRNLVRKMLLRRVIGHNHIRLETLMRLGWKPHERHLVKQTVKSLLRDGTIVAADTSKKILTLNQKRLKQIKNLYAKEG